MTERHVVGLIDSAVADEDDLTHYFNACCRQSKQIEEMREVMGGLMRFTDGHELQEPARTDLAKLRARATELLAR